MPAASAPDAVEYLPAKQAVQDTELMAATVGE
jgi:hypothetical protein